MRDRINPYLNFPYFEFMWNYVEENYFADFFWNEYESNYYDFEIFWIEDNKIRDIIFPSFFLYNPNSS